MKNGIRSIVKTSISLLVAALAFATAAHAQNRLSANIPFPFVTNNQYLSAGTYEVQQVSDCFLMIRNLERNKAQIVMFRTEQNNINGTKVRHHLVFSKVGKRYYLKEVWIAGTGTHSNVVVRPSRELELAKQMPAAGSTVVIAMK